MYFFYVSEHYINYEKYCNLSKILEKLPGELTPREILEISKYGITEEDYETDEKLDKMWDRYVKLLKTWNDNYPDFENFYYWNFVVGLHKILRTNILNLSLQSYFVAEPDTVRFLEKMYELEETGDYKKLKRNYNIKYNTEPQTVKEIENALKIAIMNDQYTNFILLYNKYREYDQNEHWLRDYLDQLAKLAGEYGSFEIIIFMSENFDSDRLYWTIEGAIESGFYGIIDFILPKIADNRSSIKAMFRRIFESDDDDMLKHVMEKSHYNLDNLWFMRYVFDNEAYNCFLYLFETFPADNYEDFLMVSINYSSPAFDFLSQKQISPQNWEELLANSIDIFRGDRINGDIVRPIFETLLERGTYSDEFLLEHLKSKVVNLYSYLKAGLIKKFNPPLDVLIDELKSGLKIGYLDIVIAITDKTYLKLTNDQYVKILEIVITSGDPYTYDFITVRFDNTLSTEQIYQVFRKAIGARNLRVVKNMVEKYGFNAEIVNNQYLLSGPTNVEVFEYLLSLDIQNYENTWKDKVLNRESTKVLIYILQNNLNSSFDPTNFPRFYFPDNDLQAIILQKYEHTDGEIFQTITDPDNPMTIEQIHTAMNEKRYHPGFRLKILDRLVYYYRIHNKPEFIEFLTKDDIVAIDFPIPYQNIINDEMTRNYLAKLEKFREEINY